MEWVELKIWHYFQRWLTKHDIDVRLLYLLTKKTNESITFDRLFLTPNPFWYKNVPNQRRKY